MKISLKTLIAVTASVMTTGAFAATNMENPLYMPKNREVYLKTAAAIMYKTVEGTQATEKKGVSGNLEFPVWRFFGDIGYGITDRLDVHGHFGYTKDGEIDRKGMHRGRIGLMFRALTEDYPFVWDLYTDAYLSGVSPMKGKYVLNKGFDFDNYSNGRWGAIVGTRFGKTWDKYTLAAHIEYLQTFGNHNNKIAIDPNPVIISTPITVTMGDIFPAELSVDLKSTHETVAGFDFMYQMDEKWSFGAGFEYIEHYDNGVKSIHTKMPEVTGVKASVQNNVINTLLQQTADMDDGWDEYVIKTSVTYQMNDTIHWTGFFEYTLDDAHAQSQNATDIKAELGIRMSARF